MCGRFSLEADWDVLAELFGLAPPSPPLAQMPPRYNIAPTQPIAMALDGNSGVREAMLVRWGLVPGWVKEPENFTLLINARAETVAEKPSFRAAMRHRRALVPASGFYEWKRFGKGRKSQAYWVRPRHGGVVAFGGLMETYAHPNGSEIDTGCILTTAANDNFAAIHHRLPLVIHPQDFDRWLDCRTQEPRDVGGLMRPVNDDYFEAIPVGDAVNKVANSDKGIQTRVEPEAEREEEADQQLSML